MAITGTLTITGPPTLYGRKVHMIQEPILKTKKNIFFYFYWVSLHDHI